jgi:hypothetical protein
VVTIHAHLPRLRLDDADQAFTAGMHYPDERHRQPLRTVAEEQERFTVFYRIVLETLGVQDPPPALLRELVEGEDDEIAIEPFPRSPASCHACATEDCALACSPRLAVGRDRLPAAGAAPTV